MTRIMFLNYTLRKCVATPHLLIIRFLFLISLFHDLRKCPILLRFTYLMCKLIIADPYRYLCISTDLVTFMWIDNEGRADYLSFLLLIIKGSATFPLLRLCIELKDWLSLNEYLLILIITIDGRLFFASINCINATIMIRESSLIHARIILS
jgi:hypothetical protein